MVLTYPGTFPSLPVTTSPKSFWQRITRYAFWWRHIKKAYLQQKVRGIKTVWICGLLRFIAHPAIANVRPFSGGHFESDAPCPFSIRQRFHYTVWKPSFFTLNGARSLDRENRYGPTSSLIIPLAFSDQPLQKG